jgi:antitoxin (DNA-binding transcriptional repressor) of toxin-antitoxin stability system
MPALSKRLPVKNSSTLRNASVAEAKEYFSSLLRSVESDHAEIVVRRRGVAVAKIIPFTETAPVSGFGWMKGTGTILGDIDGPTGEVWDVTGE